MLFDDYKNDRELIVSNTSAPVTQKSMHDRDAILKLMCEIIIRLNNMICYQWK
jgi:hypothetical protein